MLKTRGLPEHEMRVGWVKEGGREEREVGRGIARGWPAMVRATPSQPRGTLKLSKRPIFGGAYPSIYMNTHYPCINTSTFNRSHTNATLPPMPLEVGR